MNSAFSTLSNGHRPTMIRKPRGFNPLEEPLERAQVEDGFRHRELGTRFDFVLKAADFSLEILRTRIHLHADVKRGRTANRLPADIEAAVSDAQRRW